VSPWQRSTRLRIALPVKDKSRFRQSWMWRCIGIFRLGRKLQHRRALTFAKMRDKHNLTVGKFQRIMMGHGVVAADRVGSLRSRSGIYNPKEIWTMFGLAAQGHS
jgi:hypothetical protein